MPIRHFIQFSNTHTVFVGWHLLGNNVHSHLSQIHVCADASCCRDTCSSQYVADNLHRQLVSSHLISTQIGRHIHEHLIDTIDMYIFRSNIFQVSLIDLGTHLYVVCHAGWGSDIVEFEVRMSLKLQVVE